MLPFRTVTLVTRPILSPSCKTLTTLRQKIYLSTKRETQWSSPWKKAPLCPKMYQGWGGVGWAGVGWGESCRGGVGWVMQGWGGVGSCRGGVGHVGVEWGGVGHVGVGWVMQGWGGVCHVGVGWGGVGWVM